jgi:hypothetical protein
MCWGYCAISGVKYPASLREEIVIHCSQFRHSMCDPVASDLSSLGESGSCLAIDCHIHYYYYFTGPGPCLIALSGAKQGS